MSTEHKSSSRHKERKHRSRSRSRSGERSDRSKGAHGQTKLIKTERMTPERQIKREKRSPEREITREKRSPERHHRHRDDERRRDHERHKEDDRHRDDRKHRGESDSYRPDRRRNDERRMKDKHKRRHEVVDDSKFKYGKPEHESNEEETIAEEDKSKPDYGLSGKLADDTNTFRGIVVKYNEPPEARKPKIKWRLYPFKGETAMPVLHIHRQSGYLLGRDRKVADIPIDHPSCSKQHAVLQFRSVEYTKEDGMKGRRTRPYIIDLGSANGTFVNNKQIESQRYVELLEKDTIKFGFSSRDYVILHDNVDVSPTGSEGVD